MDYFLHFVYKNHVYTRAIVYIIRGVKLTITQFISNFVEALGTEKARVLLIIHARRAPLVEQALVLAVRSSPRGVQQPASAASFGEELEFACCALHAGNLHLFTFQVAPNTRS